jgi:hypothetical protein
MGVHASTDGGKIGERRGRKVFILFPPKDLAPGEQLQNWSHLAQRREYDVTTAGTYYLVVRYCSPGQQLAYGLLRIEIARRVPQLRK